MNDEKKKGTPKDTHYAKLRRAHRDQRSPGGSKQSARPAISAAAAPADGIVRLYGLHTVRAALDNPKRHVLKMLVTRNAMERLDIADLTSLPFEAEMVEPREIDRVTGSDAVHQGVTIDARQLTPKKLDALGDTHLVVVLDQVTDPHNVGAILRSAVAFGAGALITTARHSPAESGVLSKSASGALEHIDHIEVRNLAEALERLHEAGFQTVGLDSEGDAELEHVFASNRIALVLGAEGKGLRQKTRATVNALARLDMPGAIRSLNVSNAAAVALYAARRYILAAD
ncbi:MAG: RNA methyltransferase [Rhizobiaceae bacterium]|nr:RNA methyltransferase [Rhizobiaceae bacterium]